MKHLHQLTVSLRFDKEEIEVGELLSRGKKIYFQYQPEFLKAGLQISPFKLPLSDAIMTPDTMIFDGLFGVFDDSLPDGCCR